MNFRRWLLVGLLFVAIAGCEEPKRPVENSLFTWAIRNDFDTLDPALSTDAVTADVLRQVFKGLTSIDANGNLVPGLALRWSVSEDRLKYDFDLDPTATFGSGAVVTPMSIIRSFNRLSEPWANGHLGADYASDIEDVSSNDPHRVTIRLKKPRISFLYRLSHPAMAIVGPFAPDDRPISAISQMDGAGAFQPVNYVSGQELSLANRLPGDVRQLRILIMPDVSARINGYRTGSVDLTLINSQDAQAFQGKPELHITPRSQLVYLQFNRNADPVLANPRVRWALARAFDRDRLIHDIQHDLHELPTGFAAPGAKLTPPVDLPSFNPAAARRMLERAGFGKRRPFPRLEVTYMDQGRENVAVDAIITDWRTHLGIEAYGRAQDGKGLIERNRRGEVSLFFTGWNGDYPDDDNFLPMLFRSNSPENHSGFGDPEVDRLLDLSDRTADEAVRTDLLRQAHTKIAADLPILPLFITREPELLNPRWTNLPFGMFGHLDFSQLKKVPASRS